MRRHAPIKVSEMSIDEKLLTLLDELQFTSQLKTSLCIQLADYAAQRFGYRSTRQVNEKDSDKVEDEFSQLLSSLLNISYELRQFIESNSLNYKEEIKNLSDTDLQNRLESTLLRAIIFDDISIFNDDFLI